MSGSLDINNFSFHCRNTARQFVTIIDLARLHLFHKTCWVDSTLGSPDWTFSSRCTGSDHATFRVVAWWCCVSLFLLSVRYVELSLDGFARTIKTLEFMFQVFLLDNLDMSAYPLNISAYPLDHFPLKSTIYWVRILQITVDQTKSLVRPFCTPSKPFCTPSKLFCPPTI